MASDGSASVKSEDVKSDAALQAKFDRWLALKQSHDIDFNEELFKKKHFQNPNILSKIIEYADIDEFGSNLAMSLLVERKSIKEKEYNYEWIAKEQRERWEAEEAHKSRAAPQLHTATTKMQERFYSRDHKRHATSGPQ